MSSENSPVKDFYDEKNIFVTGATGFLGIALVEKLLRSCNVETIYLLMRPKRGKDISERLEELKKNLIFEKIKEEKGDAPFSKLVAIPGDVGEEGLGLSGTDRENLVNDVQIVFHSAATLDFEAGLRPTVTINLLGTRQVVELCTQMKNIQVLVHVSSAYVNSNRDAADEIIYDIPQKPDEAINLVKGLSDEALEELEPKFLGNHPNTYTITKALAEREVAGSAEKFPSAIVRPSMIVAAWKEPTPGWTISKNGPQGFIMGASKGVIRRLPVQKELVYDYIPVDIVVNTLILAGWQAAKTRTRETLIFHCTSSTTNPFSWMSVENRINFYLRKYPLKSAVWYPTMKLLPNLTLFKISAIIFHFIPAFFFDFMLKMTGGRTMLVRLHKNVNRSLNRLAPFIFKEWFYDNSKTQALQKSLTESDKETFNTDITKLVWVDFFENLVKGVRRYLHNETMKTLPSAKTKQQIYFVFNTLIQALIFGIIWYLGSLASGKGLLSVVWILPITYALFSIL
ncbi:male sterility domain-containing protein, putative [Pediculus humanus corporis]|uniref:Fatty acyl-CoA reductase n=1 Tax=Pediculus humanus subsp. corporis TaxID=121224 RepID=E0VLJ9_PEDHC|nr:male sterility domain-containing protein, putative [Pediculus humanus corporis]EEB14255.1 male sterility domain-containing protein, putative [Pediculus humanus corporis]